jgi:hypothetical protein
MKRICGRSRLALLGIVVLTSLLAVGVPGASAESPTWLCVPKTAGKAVTSGGISTKATCEKETVLVELPPASEMPTLVSILSHMKYEASGIDSQPTIRISGVNVQIINGAGTTATNNGKGNLVIGYNEAAGMQTGSHNLILGDEQEFTSYGGILAGGKNIISAPFASVTGGFKNAARAQFAAISGGYENSAEDSYSAVAGGRKNTASGEYASVTGGLSNTANKSYASVSGGAENKAEGTYASITGGGENDTTGEYASVQGGRKNKTPFNYSSIFGGKELATENVYETKP